MPRFSNQPDRDIGRHQERMAKPGMAACLVFAALLYGGCVAVPITPARLAAAKPKSNVAGEALVTWREAVDVCNVFLKSKQRRTLPAGIITLDDEGMRYTHEQGTIPIAVKCTSFGDVLVRCHMAAQERSWGFVVGGTAPHGDRLTDNSFFRYRDGKRVANIHVAALILHELTHTYFHSGIDDPWNAFRYYAEACLLFRYRTHSMERLPYQTSAEFYAFIAELRKAHPDWFHADEGTPVNGGPAPSALNESHDNRSNLTAYPT